MELQQKTKTDPNGLIPPYGGKLKNLITKDNNFKNLLPPLHLLPKDQEIELNTLLKNLDFDIEIPRAA